MAKRHHQSFFWRAYRRVDVPMPWRTWEKMPRHPAFKNEYWDGVARYTPRPRSTPAVLHFRDAKRPDARGVGWQQRDGGVPNLRRIEASDWDALAPALVASMPNDPPFGQWRRSAAVRAARQALRECRDGCEGRLIGEACLLATLPSNETRLVDALSADAAIIVTETRRPADYAIADAECVVRDGKPVAAHLTFIFSSWHVQRHGLATRLLWSAVDRLQTLGYGALASSVLLSPEHSALWHWRNGFEVGSYFSRFRDAAGVNASTS